MTACNPKIFILHLNAIWKYFTWNIHAILKYFSYILLHAILEYLSYVWLNAILKYCAFLWLNSSQNLKYLIFAPRIPKTSSNVGHRRGEKIYHLEEWVKVGRIIKAHLRWLNISSATAQERADTNLWRSKSCEKVRVLTQNDLKKKVLKMSQICHLAYFCVKKWQPGEFIWSKHKNLRNQTSLELSQNMQFSLQTRLLLDSLDLYAVA